MSAPAKGAMRGWVLLRDTILRGTLNVASILPGGSAPPLTAPSNLVPPSISGTPSQGNTLTVTPGSWTGNPTPSVTRKWFRNGLDTGQTGFTYDLTFGDVNDTLDVVETGTNSQGTATATSNTVGPISGSGTLSAPELGYPSPLSANPTTIPVTLGVDWQSGDTLNLARSASLDMSSSTVLTHVITDADLSAGTINIGLSGVVLSGVTYFQAYGTRGGNPSSNRSNIVAWGDTVAPTINTVDASVTETFPLALALTASEPVALWEIAGGADQLQFDISGSTLEWINNGSQSYSTPLDQGSNNVYNVDVRATDYSGNATVKSLAITVLQADLTPDAFTWTNVGSAELNTQYTSANIWTISGLGAGVNAPVSVAGGLISVNGGAYSSASTTVQNGDTIRAQGVSSVNYATQVQVAVTVGTLTETFAITTKPDPTAASFVPGVWSSADLTNTTAKTFSNQSFPAGFPLVNLAGFYAASVTLRPVLGGSPITLTKVIANDDPTRKDVSQWIGPAALAAADYHTDVTFDQANSEAIMLPGALSIPSGVGTVSDTNAVPAASAASYSAAIVVPTKGVWVAIAMNYAATPVTFTWSGGAATKVSDVSESASGPSVSVAYGAAGGTVTATPSNSNFGTMAIASWGA